MHYLVLDHIRAYARFDRLCALSTAGGVWSCSFSVLRVLDFLPPTFLHLSS